MAQFMPNVEYCQNNSELLYREIYSIWKEKFSIWEALEGIEFFFIFDGVASHHPPPPGCVAFGEHKSFMCCGGVLIL